MAKVYYKNKKKTTLGWCLIGLSLLLFIFSVIPHFVMTNFFLGTFGIAWFAYLIILALFGLANVLNLRYNYNKKFTIYLCLSVGFLVMLLHIMVSTSSLVDCEGFKDFSKYLSICYNMTSGISVGGALIGIFVYFLKTILGLVGVYAVTIIALSIFVGIVLDSIIYGNNKKTKAKQVKFAVQKESIVAPREEKTFSHNISAEDKSSTSETVINNYTDITTINEPISEQQLQQQRAKETLFKPNFDSYKPEENKTDKTARDILFGSRELPDITMPNDKERDMWVKNYREEHETKANEDVSELFGSTSENTADLSEAYRRNFPTMDVSKTFNNSQNLSSEDIVPETSINIEPVSTNFERDTGLSRGLQGSDRTLRDNSLNSENLGDLATERTAITDRGINRLNTNNDTREGISREFTSERRFTSNSTKLGENLEDVAKSSKIDFNSASKPVQKTVGKQMGFKSVRYNSIPISMFRIYEEQNADYSEEYRRKTAALEKVMEDFRIGAKVINVVRGPKVTRYELTLPDGVSVSRVLNIETDISMAIEAKSKIRIEAPIPGKKAFGIELENDVPSTVGMRELLESPEFANCKDPLPIAIGKDINGKVIIKSLPKMIHLLVAGSSGSGKSIFIHSLMMSILYKYSPDDVRFIMIDPKRVEFSMYNNLPHLMLPNVVSEHDKALNSIKWCVQEMDDRYKKLQQSECQNLEQYNKQPEVLNGSIPKMPYLIIVVDELAELMGGALKKDFEAGIQRITQLGRAAGIHMVVATQRPSVDVVTGTIKNNMPTRVAFALASFADSKTVLDEGGAENLLGKGDMLFAPQDMNIKIRLQAAFCDNDEIRNAIKYVKENNESTYDEDVMKQVYAAKTEESSTGGEGGIEEDGGMDDYMKLAVKFAKATGKVSVSMLQRKFRIGFNRAARIVDQMCEFGWVGPSIGSKPRDFIISDEQYEEMFGPDDDTTF